MVASPRVPDQRRDGGNSMGGVMCKLAPITRVD
jgi:hypothetical protein